MQGTRRPLSLTTVSLGRLHVMAYRRYRNYRNNRHQIGHAGGMVGPFYAPLRLTPSRA
jgi:hypothetical protein